MSSDPMKSTLEAFRSEHDGPRLDTRQIRDRVLRTVRVQHLRSRRRIHWMLLAAGTLVGSGVLAASRARLNVEMREPRSWLEQGTPFVSGSMKSTLTRMSSARSAVHSVGNLRLAVAPATSSRRQRAPDSGKTRLRTVSQIVTIDRSVLSDRVGSLSKSQIALLFAGLDVVLDRSTSIRG